MNIQNTLQYKKNLAEIQKQYGFADAEDARRKWWHNDDIAGWLDDTIYALLEYKEALLQEAILTLKDAQQQGDCEDGVRIIYLPAGWLPFEHEDVVERGWERLRELGLDPDDGLITHEDVYYEFVTALVWTAAELTEFNKALEEAAKTCGVEYDYALSFEKDPSGIGNTIAVVFICPEKREA